MIKFLLGVVVGIGLVVLASYLFVKGGGVFMGTDAKPLPFEDSIADAAIRASIGKSANDESPLPADGTNLLAGAKIYMQACAGCHGRLDQASGGSKSFYPRPPHLLPPGTGVTDDPVGATHWVVENGVRFSAMPRFDKKMSDTEIWQVSLLLRNANKLPDSVKESLRQPEQQ
ncbi:MAG TPA: cytochrome c [Candidatus Udaeobacter sp.]|jgi:mono/diheme cytochrome c family protein|nr:cytochrome c [Candidatus Udaeobacter sp.]